VVDIVQSVVDEVWEQLQELGAAGSNVVVAKYMPELLP
jgi:hypothetical protein